MKTQATSKVMGIGAAFALAFASQASAEGNRYDLPREYLSEISAAKAYLEMKNQSAILIDVRRLREYAAGHPDKAFNVPYPHIVDSNDQPPDIFYWAVHNLVGGKVDTPVITLCRTGYRSVLAGNVLANPGAYGITTGQPFTNVRNVWEGFVGRYKEANVDPLPLSPPPSKGELLAHEALHHNYLDLNNNGQLDVDDKDVYDHTADANPDKDGWRNYQELPWDTTLHVNRVYLQDLGPYAPYVE